LTMIWNVCLDTTTIVIENLYNKVTVAELSSGEGCEGCEDSMAECSHLNFISLRKEETHRKYRDDFVVD
jgi:hypothetical protein